MMSHARHACLSPCWPIWLLAIGLIGGRTTAGQEVQSGFRLSDATLGLIYLTQAKYRGGDGPDDLYRRIAHGIPGTQMPGYKNVLGDDDVWDVVNFLRSLRPKEFRDRPGTPRAPTPKGVEQ